MLLYLNGYTVRSTLVDIILLNYLHSYTLNYVHLAYYYCTGIVFSCQSEILDRDPSLWVCDLL